MEHCTERVAMIMHFINTLPAKAWVRPSEDLFHQFFQITRAVKLSYKTVNFSGRVSEVKKHRNDQFMRRTLTAKYV